MRRADYLANKAAAAQQIPTPWRRYVIGSAAWVFFGYLLYVDVRLLSLLTQTPIPAPLGINQSELWAFWLISLLLGLFGLAGLLFAYRLTVVYMVHNVRERARFIAEDCPADFVTRSLPKRRLFAVVLVVSAANLAVAILFLTAHYG
jgi:hypothetical protein